MKAQELNEMTNDKLGENVKELRRELVNLRFQHATAQLENTARIPEVKKDIARILTVMNSKDKG